MLLPTSKFTEQLANTFIDLYQNTVHLKYKNLLEINPDVFRLYDKANVAAYRMTTNKEFFEHNDHLYFVFSRNSNFSILELDLTDLKYYHFDTPFFEKTQRDILLEYLEDVSKGDIICDIYIPTNLEEVDDFAKELYKRNAESLLTKETVEFQSHNNKPQSFYAKNAARYAYSELDLNPIINRINDEDFSYQLDQAIAAYDFSLYLPACATLGVCLETVCKLLLQRNGVKIKDSDSTMLDGLGERLKANGIINYKLKGRIDVCYKVRNLASHTSPGKIVKSDCHFILNTISEIAEGYF
ncbi:hypothetical protein ACTWP4_00210 [Gracilibacillus sp. D59]|uniref:hypothetical protein n=1 Tax=Gracilibacillus sp. D59 TaxID=3457434 RepID=UPI003FCE8AD9